MYYCSRNDIKDEPHHLPPSQSWRVAQQYLHSAPFCCVGGSRCLFPFCFLRQLPRGPSRQRRSSGDFSRLWLPQEVCLSSRRQTANRTVMRKFIEISIFFLLGLLFAFTLLIFSLKCYISSKSVAESPSSLCTDMIQSRSIYILWARS